MKKCIFLFLTTLFVAVAAFGQDKIEVTIPKFNDKYSEYVKKLEAGETNIDYQDFRFSFIDSEQFRIANRNSQGFDALIKEMYVQMDKLNYNEIVVITKKMLSIDYTSMIAHKILRQTYQIIGDSLNAAKYKSIQFGLLNSIVNSGDGKTCPTAWKVIQVSEEYFILEMLESKVLSQALYNENGLCDKIDVRVDGVETTYYFDIRKVFEGYEKLFK